MPSCGVSLDVKGPSCEVGLDLSLDVKAPSLDVKMPSCEVSLDVKAPSLDVKMPRLPACDVEVEIDVDVPACDVQAETNEATTGDLVDGTFVAKVDTIPKGCSDYIS